MFDLGLTLTARAVRRQLAAMPCELYLVRLIHNATKRPFPGERLWTATQLANLATVRFLRIRNREGCDVYIHPYAPDRNAGYVLIDLDDADPAVLSSMRANGHEPCVVVQTSPGHCQAWVHISSTPLEPALATAVGRHLAQLYGGDRASIDWRHLGRLAVVLFGPGFAVASECFRPVFAQLPFPAVQHVRVHLTRPRHLGNGCSQFQPPHGGFLELLGE